MDELFRVPPADFVAARDALVKELKAAGDKAAAAEIKSLRRPSLGAWAVNQVARDQPELVDAVVDAGASVRSAQEALLAGGEAGDLRAATAARRDAVRAATKAAVALVGAAHRDGITATFDAAAADDEAAEAVRAGRLSKELDAPSGFELLGVAPGDPGHAPGKDHDDTPEDGKDTGNQRAIEQASARAEETAAAAAAARQRADEAAARQRELEKELASAAVAAEGAAQAADDAARVAEEAAAKVRDLTGR